MNAMSSEAHREAWLLLPWLVNGRLPAAERVRVEQHVHACADCTREVELQRLICRTLTEPERVTYSPAPSLRKLMERIDAPASAAAAQPASLATRAARARAAWRPPGLAWAASFLLAVGLTALAATAYRWSQPLYTTHTEAAPASPGVLHVAFDRSLTMGETQELLLRAGARVVEGPDATGVFGVAPAAAAAARADSGAALAALATRLRSDARVRWVQPQAGGAAVSGMPRPPSRGP